jgi:hypothetical protein
MPPITPIHPVQAKDGRSYRRLAPAVQELMGGKGPNGASNATGPVVT